ncbi:uncharacterized protein An09g05430 [Aspergillus niger]|uniref:Contig An09c0170, genomic contig n=2 Tax=Aspergillus niger TaxID=5061 RepID=A2QUF1_ASPNC|nr:uncharacterized protein An09g05430 [Aspergillus niger]CAL00820.1 unnamed protein product [Aspergillus niger]
MAGTCSMLCLILITLFIPPLGTCQAMSTHSISNTYTTPIATQEPAMHHVGRREYIPSGFSAAVITQHDMLNLKKPKTSPSMHK